MKLTVAGTLALSTLLWLAPSSYAADFDELIRNYLGVGVGGKVETNQAFIKTNFNNRQAQLEAEIAAGAASGQLTPQEEGELRAELNRIAAQEGTYLADGNFSNWEVKSLLDELTTFSTRLGSYLTNTTTVGTGGYSGSRWFHRHLGRGGNYSSSQQRRLQADIDTKQAQIDSTIDQGIRSGQLTYNEARNLRVQLTQINNNETRHMADGRLSYGEAQQLVAELDALSDRVTRQMTDSDWSRRRRAWDQRGSSGRGWGSSGQTLGSAVDARQSLLQQRISRGIASGKLTRQEADKLYQREQRIASLEAQLRTSGSRLSYTEERRLLSELDDLSHRLNKELNDLQVQ